MKDLLEEESVRRAVEVARREIICSSNGSANFCAVEPRLYRIIIVVLWLRRGRMTSGGELTGVLHLDNDMIESGVDENDIETDPGSRAARTSKEVVRALILVVLTLSELGMHSR